MELLITDVCNLHGCSGRDSSCTFQVQIERHVAHRRNVLRVPGPSVQSPIWQTRITSLSRRPKLLPRRPPPLPSAAQYSPERVDTLVKAMTLFGKIDRFFGAADVALLASKQNHCWSVSHVTLTTRMSDELELLPRKTETSTTPSIVTKAAVPLSAKLTITTGHIPKQSLKNYVRFHSYVLAPPDGACTSLPSHPTLCYCSPYFMGDSTNVATVDVSQARKTTAHLTLKIKVQFTAKQKRPLNSCLT